MNISRRSFLGAAGAAGASIALPGCCCFDCCCGSKAQVALQLYSIRTYIGGKKDKSGKELMFEAEKVLMAVGRRANTAGIGLENIGVEMNRGIILTDEKD